MPQPRSTQKQEVATRPPKAALWYARVMKWAVLPIWWIRNNGSCACGDRNCEHPGKHPIGLLVKHGYKDATKDLEKIAHWWKRFPKANIAVATGAISGFFAIDIDPRNRGEETLESLEDAFGKLPETVMQFTGGGGKHYFFKHPGFRVKSDSDGTVLGPGIDIKGDGSYVVVPPSNHV